MHQALLVYRHIVSLARKGISSALNLALTFLHNSYESGVSLQTSHVYLSISASIIIKNASYNND